MDKELLIQIRKLSEVSPEIRRHVGENGAAPFVMDGLVFFRIGELVYSCPDTGESRALLSGFRPGEQMKGQGPSEESAWEAVIIGSAGPEALRPYGIRDREKRCVVLIRPLQGTIPSLFREAIPLDEGDRAVPMRNGDVILLLSMGDRTNEEVFEFAAAAAETLENEIGVLCCAGIGRPADTIGGIPDSYREAGIAAETGIRHQIPGRVYTFDRQALERLADLIPEKDAAVYRRMILPPQAKKVLTDDLLETIRVFFQNDLNLSTTARQLFLHRNTLLYRMEKIRKATGLDLRRFEDAAVFRLVMCLPEKDT